MPIKRAAYKQIRSDKKKRFKNISTLTVIKTVTTKLNNLIASKNKDKISSALRDFSSIVNKAAQKGIIPKRTASRKIARMSNKVSKILKAS